MRPGTVPLLLPLLGSMLVHWTTLSAADPPQETNLALNDVHSRLNSVNVAEVIRPTSIDEVIKTVLRARAEGKCVSIAGARHAMGGQQFASDALHLDMTRMTQLVKLDVEQGLAVVQAGATWPELIDALTAAQPGKEADLWTIRQKQTGADVLTLGGAVSANIHGRGLMMRPFVDDIESLTLVDAEGKMQKLSREPNAPLFRLVAGGYGLFGVIVEVELRLTRRQLVERVVEIGPVKDLPEKISQRVNAGFVLGDFQFCPDIASKDLLNEGVFSCYRPAPAGSAMSGNRAALNPEAWRKLLAWAHSDMAKGWSAYKTHYQRTHGQLYWSDLTQLSHYDPDYEHLLEAAIPALAPGSLMISEVYVPRGKLEDFLKICAQDFREHQTKVIYGTIRFIQKDSETFLAWAKEDYACIVVNLRVTHSAEGLERAKQEFRRLIDRALERGGSFFLTYHRWASREQMLQAYPQFPEFLRLKKKYDPQEVFQSEWYRHWRSEFAGRTAPESPPPTQK